MHFLCLHGLGTNSRILQVQTATLRHELGDSHTFDYAEGTLPCPIDPAIAPYFPEESDEGYAYFDPSRPSTYTAALEQLEAFLVTEGPFDGILAFSQGAQLAASFLIAAAGSSSSSSSSSFPGARSIRCAIFLSGGIPYQWSSAPSSSSPALGPALTPIAEAAADNSEGAAAAAAAAAAPAALPVLLHLPTAHIWGQNDTSYPGTSVVLSQLCRPEWRAVFVHEGGHEIPGSRSRASLLGAVRAIRQTIHLAVTLH
ncbi:hypothetical protein BO86DRAFT_423607 [Aspergillus japonicus CBS 114.51]|uniref:Serine hydrolase domain-containing protein n=1 Tax=Aspergillus japonicus CBS 114.51 TaxID=1448312 RepID=A0A8T8WJG3_ASPJA|nr:hypothetical protein BO86DRAFT_423607 [Aspergillus japonicus CBS 114.51]RAH75856.1 hypothetical protein BO86DRAFT_423607 [Aspergillus japonicus CBS 114.51]